MNFIWNVIVIVVSGVIIADSIKIALNMYEPSNFYVSGMFMIIAIRMIMNVYENMKNNRK